MADADAARRPGSAKPVKSKRQQDPFSRTAGFLKCAVTQHDDLYEWDKVKFSTAVCCLIAVLLLKRESQALPLQLQDVLLDTIYWLRQTVMLLLGVLYGLLPFTGLYAFVT